MLVVPNEVVFDKLIMLFRDPHCQSHCPIQQRQMDQMVSLDIFSVLLCLVHIRDHLWRCMERV